jgi:hypothetical protein
MVEVVSTIIIINHFIENKDKMTGMISPFTYHVSESLIDVFLDEINQCASKSFWKKYLTKMTNCTRIV